MITMESWKRYLELKERLEQELDLERRRLFDSVVAEIVMCVETFGITEQDIFKPERTRIGRRRKAKYFDPATGQTWSGVGREPRWIRGRDRNEFLIDEANSNK